MINPLFLYKSKNKKIVQTQEDFDNLVIQENDTILLDGDFYGSVNLDQSNVTLTGGSIKGSQEITGFTDEGGGIYSKTIIEPFWVYIDNQDASLAKYSTPIAITGVPSNNQLQVNSGDVSGIDVENAKCIYIPNNFSLSTEFIVTSEVSGLLTLNKPHDQEIYAPAIGEELFFYNKLEFISNNYDWCYDDGKLYIKLPSDPTNYTINAVYQNQGVLISSDNCTVKNVELKEFYKSAIFCSQTQNISILSNEIHHIREDGIQIIRDSDNNIIVNNTIYECGTGGIRQTTSINSTIKLNTIYNIGTQDTLGWLKDYVTSSRNIIGFGVLWASYNETLTNAISEGHTIEKNTIYNCAYNGITSHKGRNTLITKNVIHDVLQVFEDGGGIYTFYFRDSYPELASGIEISYNFIYNIPDGWSNSGIYQDNRSGANNIHHNVVYNVSGKYVAWANIGTTGQIFNDNVFYGGITYTLYHAYNTDGTQPNATNVEINRNILIQTANLNCLRLNGNVYGSGDNNYFVNPYFTKVGNGVDLAGLQALFGQDANSTELTDYIAIAPDPNNEILLITNPSDNELSGTAPIGNWYDVDSNLITNYTVSAWSSLVLLKDLI